MKEFAGRVAAITGAGSGIGRALAIQLAGQGCHLALADIDPDGLSGTQKILATAPVTVTTATVDVASKEAVFAWADDVMAAHEKVNLVFNNAGVAMGGSVEHTPVEDYEWLLGINLWGVIYGTKAFLPHLRKADAGHIINVSSVFGLFAQPTQSAYNASKFAVRGFTESLRQELDSDGGRVSCTCVHPGGIATNIARNARMHSSVQAILGSSQDEAREGFEKALHVSPTAAARTILGGVRRDARRVLIGPEAYAVDLLQRAVPTGYQKVVPMVARLL